MLVTDDILMVAPFLNNDNSFLTVDETIIIDEIKIRGEEILTFEKLFPRTTVMKCTLNEWYPPYGKHDFLITKLSSSRYPIFIFTPSSLQPNMYILNREIRLKDHSNEDKSSNY